MVSTSMPTEPSTAGMTRREKCAWINLVVTLAVYLPYFGYVGVLLARGEFRLGAVLPALLVAIVAGIVLSVVAIALFVARARPEPKDERDISLESRSLRIAYWVLAALGFAVLVVEPAIFFGPLTARNDAGFVALLAAQGFLLCFVVAEVVRFAVLAAGYRRGF